MKYILSYILCWLHSKSSLWLYVWTSCVDLQWSRLAVHQTIFWNLVPITDDKLKSMIKHLWSPIPPLCGRICTLTHSILAIANTASIGMTPSLNVGGMCMPVQPKHCSLKLRSACARHFAICPVYMFSLKSPSNIHAPLGARAYPWILSKYFPSVCVSVPLQISAGCVYCV